MKRIIIATKNEGKAREFKTFFEPRGFTVKTLNDLKKVPEIVENGTTFAENAYIKASTLTALLNETVLADDSGLLVDALQGAPGIYSARYAGDHDEAANNAKLLKELKGIPLAERTARFHTSLVVTGVDKKALEVTGEVTGNILEVPRGVDGFGYDPLFYVPELKKTFAQLTPAEKNRISHRGRALAVLNEKFDDWWKS
ncbi:XTP/dITP diphosphatase [Liquorilactobacillus oeni]|uniref:dITP/XTP pyrophosphatase n=1 Tax=Liquorilactobacillus oeni DSM 19972 TaxID=1423777 RepID=A0A0R1MIA5_9LACO|nr:XTP/dITP diphosphatase [Liquorilactobacillus oeni]KRL05010.1 HAM1 protein [Liquorilactobacillus oeni DSM 19972]